MKRMKQINTDYKLIVISSKQYKLGPGTCWDPLHQLHPLYPRSYSIILT